MAAPSGDPKHNITYDIDDMLFSQSKRAEMGLQQLIEEETPEEIIERLLRNVPIEEARAAASVLTRETGRELSRVLFITEDEAYLDAKSYKTMHLRSASVFFDELHVLVLSTKSIKVATERLTDTIWVYRAGAPDWLSLPEAALARVSEELMFGEAFRPDIIVGLNPFGAGLAALKIARQFNRPHQIHILKDYFSSRASRKAVGYWKLWAAWYLLRRSPSVRVATEQARIYIENKYRPADLRILPQFYNFKSLLDVQASFDVHERYKASFVALTFASLTAESQLHETITALHTILHNPSIQLIVVGSGPAKDLFVKKTKLLKIDKNVIFLDRLEDIVSYLKTADVLVETDMSPESETRVLRAAAAGLPIVAYATEQRRELFHDGESAALIEPGDVYELEKNITAFLNNAAIRVQYRDGARAVVEDRLEEDPVAYYRSYRDSIEFALIEADKT